MNYVILGTGAIPSTKDVRDYTLDTSVVVNSSGIPDEFHHKKFIVVNQQDKATSVPFSVSRIAEYYNRKYTGNDVRFSTQFIYGSGIDSNDSSEGMCIRDGLKAFQKYGDVTYRKFPGNSSKSEASMQFKDNMEDLIESAKKLSIGTYYKIRNNSELTYSLYNHGPVITGIKFYSESNLDSNMILQYVPSKVYVCQAVVIIGWNPECWIAQNSWGAEWGDNSCFYIPKCNSFENLFFDTYGVSDNEDNIVKPPMPSNKARVMNYFVNFSDRLKHLI